MNNTNKEFTHIRKNDLPSMVDVSDKSFTERKAVAMARIHLGHEPVSYTHLTLPTILLV